MTASYDVIIIGSGAGGGTLARHLASSGKSILILERGDWLPREQQNWDAEEVFMKNRYVPKETWYDSKGKTFQPGVHYWVGGATKLYGAALYRLRHRAGHLEPEASPSRRRQSRRPGQAAGALLGQEHACRGIPEFRHVRQLCVRHGSA